MYMQVSTFALFAFVWIITSPGCVKLIRFDFQVEEAKQLVRDAIAAGIFNDLVSYCIIIFL